MSILRKINLGARIVWRFQNWHAVLLRRLGWASNTEYKLRNGIRFRMPAVGENYMPIIEIWLDRAYTPRGDEIQEGDTVVDIGAHAGVFSIFAASRSTGVRVLSYEPEPQNFSLLQENIRLNGLENISLFQMAVAGRNGRGKLRVSPSSSMKHHLVLPDEIDAGVDKDIEVDCVTLGEILSRVGRCDFLKMDCEGAEYDIIYNTPGELLGKVGIISMECHDLPELAAQGHGVSNLKAYLEGVGFSVVLTSEPSMRGKHRYLIYYIYARR